MADDGRTKKVNEFMSTIEEITATLAHDMTINHFIVNDLKYDGSYHNSVDIALKYSTKLKDGDPIVFSYADKLEKELSRVFKDKKSSELLSMNILEFFPEYMKQLKQEV